MAKKRTYKDFKQFRKTIRKLEKEVIKEAYAPDTKKPIPGFSLAYVAQHLNISAPYVKKLVEENHELYEDSDPRYIEVVQKEGSNVKKLEQKGINALYDMLNSKNPKKHPSKKLQKPVVIAVASNKGGTGKSTLAGTVASGLATFHGRRVRIIELDSQGTLNHQYDINEQDSEKSSYTLTAPYPFEDELDANKHSDELVNRLKESVHQTSNINLSIIPASFDLSGAEFELAAAQMENHEFSFWKPLAERHQLIDDDVDVVILDCPPTLSFLVIQALYYSDIVLIPTLAKREAFHSLDSYCSLIGDTFEQICPEKNVYIRTLVNKYEDTAEEKRYSGLLYSVFEEDVIDTLIVDSVEIGREKGGFNNVYERQSASASFKRIMDHVKPTVASIDELISEIGIPDFELEQDKE